MCFDAEDLRAIVESYSGLGGPRHHFQVDPSWCITSRGTRADPGWGPEEL